MAFVLVPVLDLALWYLTDDFLGTKTSDEWKIIKIVLVNKAENKMDSDKSNAQFACAITAGVISLAAAAMSKPAPAEEEVAEEEEYYEEEGEGEEEEVAEDSYYGYY